MRVRERAQAKKLVERFEAAVLDRSMKLAAQGQTKADAEQEHFEAKFELLTYIYKLGASSGNTKR